MKAKDVHISAQELWGYSSVYMAELPGFPCYEVPCDTHSKYYIFLRV